MNEELRQAEILKLEKKHASHITARDSENEQIKLTEILLKALHDAAPAQG
jgi:hypothetical protein